MISIETTKQHFRTSTLTLSIFNIIFAVVSVIALLGIAVSLKAIESGQLENLPKEQIAAIKMSVTPFNIALIVFGMIVNIVIAVLGFLNLSKLKKALLLSPWPYYLAIALATIAFLTSFVASINLMTILIQLVVQGAFIFLSFYALQQTKILNDNLK